MKRSLHSVALLHQQNKSILALGSKTLWKHVRLYVCNGEKREKVGHEHMRRSIMRSNLTLVLFWRREEGSAVPERLINLRDTAFFSSSSTENMHVFSIYVYFVLISGHSHHWQMGTWHNVSSSHESCSMRGSEEGKQTLRLSDLFKHQLKIL